MWVLARLKLVQRLLDLIFAPEDTPIENTKYETWKNCSVLHRGVKAGETDGILEDISGEAEDVTIPEDIVSDVYV